MTAPHHPSRSPAIEVSVVVPVFNEEGTIDELVRRIVDTCSSLGRRWELILVDDGSDDRSVELIERAVQEHPLHIKGLVLVRNFGQHPAIVAGFGEASGEIVVTLDADLQNPPEEIARLVEKMDEGYDIVGGVREKRDDSLYRRAASAIVNHAARRLTGSSIADHGCMLRAYRRSVVDAMLRCGEQSTFIPVLAAVFARRTVDIPVAHAARPAGESKYGLWQLINLQFDLMTSMTTLPLRLLGVLGAALAIGAVGFGGLLIIMRFAFGSEWAADGVFSLFAILFLLVGLQFVAMGLLGEYLGRVYMDVRARPRWIVSRVIASEGASPPEIEVDIPAPGRSLVTEIER